MNPGFTGVGNQFILRDDEWPGQSAIVGISQINTPIQNAMPKNVEIKARLDDFDRVARRATEISGGPAELIVQEDIFFHCQSGRLKLRMFADNSAELIAYRRADETGPKSSDYVIASVPDPQTMRETLKRSLGIRSVVRKTRHLFLAGRTRIHLDRVDGLGDFLELEVVMKPDEAEAIGVAEARELMQQLSIPDEALIDRAYVDLKN